MSLKNVHLKCQCANCSQYHYKKHVLVNIEQFPVPEHTNKAIRAYFPDINYCPKCGSPRLDFTYNVFFSHKYQRESPTEIEQAIDRCKAQIASTYDYNNDIPHKDREIIRTGFQEQLRKLLNENNID